MAALRPQFVAKRSNVRQKAPTLGKTKNNNKTHRWAAVKTARLCDSVLLRVAGLREAQCYVREVQGRRVPVFRQGHKPLRDPLDEATGRRILQPIPSLVLSGERYFECRVHHLAAHPLVDPSIKLYLCRWGIYPSFSDTCSVRHGHTTCKPCWRMSWC